MTAEKAGNIKREPGKAEEKKPQQAAPPKSDVKPDAKPKADEKPKAEQEEKRTMDDPMRVLARRAIEVAESDGHSLGSAVTAPQAEVVKDRLGGNPLGKFQPATVEQMLAYAQGGRGAGRDQLPEEAVGKLRDFCRQIGNRRIWPRKVSAMVVALEEQRQKRLFAPKKEPPAPKEEPKPAAEKKEPATAAA